MNKLISSLMAVFAAIVFFAPSQALAAAFGVSPPWIENNNVKAGSNFVYVINVSSNNLPEEMSVEAEFSGDPEIMQWLTVQNKEKLVMAKGQSIVPMSVNVNVPENAKIGDYKGDLRLALKPKSADKANNITTLLGSNISITLKVINYDVTDYWVRSVTTDPSITEGQPITLAMDLKNLGNTVVESVLTRVSVVDMKTGKSIASGTVDQLNVPVQPQTLTKAKLNFLASDLTAGDYWVDVESFNKNESVYKNRLHITVTGSTARNEVNTGVTIVKPGMKAAAPDTAPDPVKEAMEGQTDVSTSVTVKAPITNQLIIVVIVILLILTGIVGKMYLTFKKKRR